MKFYTNKEFKGKTPPAAAIVKARNKEHAAEILNAELRRKNMEAQFPVVAEDMVLWPLRGEQVRILRTTEK